jgi:hypothetical protein
MSKCAKSNSLNYYHENIKNDEDYMEVRRLAKREWYLNNKDYVSAYYRDYRERNKEKIALNNLVWRLDNGKIKTDLEKL